MEVNLDSMMDGDGDLDGELDGDSLEPQTEREIRKHIASIPETDVAPGDFEGSTYLGDFSVYEGHVFRTEDALYPVAVAKGSESVKPGEAGRIVEEFPDYFKPVLDGVDMDVGLVDDVEAIYEENGYEVPH